MEDLLLTDQELPSAWVLQGRYITGCPSESPCVRRVAPLPLSPELAETWQRNGTEGSREEVFAKFALIADDGRKVLIQGSQELRSYRTPAVARSQYSGEVEVYQFSPSETWEDISSDANFPSPYATRWRIGCSQNGSVFKERCLYFAVYEEFLVSLSLIIRDPDSSASIDRDEFIELVRAVDREMGSRLYHADKASK